MTTALELSHLRGQNLHPVLTSPLHSLKLAPSLLFLVLTSFNCSAICPQTWNEGLSGGQHHSLQAQCREFKGPSPERGLHKLPWTVVRSLPPVLVACMSDNWKGWLSPPCHSWEAKNSGTSLEFMCLVLKINGFPPQETPSGAKQSKSLISFCVCPGRWWSSPETSHT